MDAFDAYDVCGEMHHAAQVVARRDHLTVTEVLHLERFQEAAEIAERMAAWTEKIQAAAHAGVGSAEVADERQKLVAEFAEKVGLAVSDVTAPS